MASPQVVALQQQITILEGQLSALKNASDTLDDAQQQIVALRQQLDASRAQLSAAQADDAADKAAIASLQQQLAAAQADDAADEATIADLRAQLAAVTPPVVEPPPVEQPPVVEPPVVEPPSDPNAILTVLDFGGHHWTFGDLRPTGGKDRAIVMDGTPLAGGYASGYWSDGATLYVVTESRSWWKLDGTGFAQVASDPRAPVAPPATPGTPSEPAKSVVVPGLNGWTFSVEHANSAQRREGYDRLVTIQGWGSNGYADWLVTDGVNAYLHSGDLDIWQKFVPSPDWHWETCADPRGPDAPALPPVDDGVIVIIQPDDHQP